MKKTLFIMMLAVCCSSFWGCKKNAEQQYAPKPRSIAGTLWEADYSDYPIKYNNVIKFESEPNFTMYIRINQDNVLDEHISTYKLRQDSVIMTEIIPNKQKTPYIGIFQNYNLFTSDFGLADRVISFKRFILVGTSWKCVENLDNGVRTSFYTLKDNKKIEWSSEFIGTDESFEKRIKVGTYTLNYPLLTILMGGEVFQFKFIDSRTLTDQKTSINYLRQ